MPSIKSSLGGPTMGADMKFGDGAEVGVSRVALGSALARCWLNSAGDLGVVDGAALGSPTKDVG